MYTHFNALINELKNMNKDYSTLEKNKKFMNALSLKWKIKVITIKERKHNKTLLVEIFGSLITNEMNEERRNPPTNKEKSIALGAKDSSPDDDEEIAMLSRKIEKLIWSERRVGNM